MAFDYQKALTAGYSNEEITEFLKFDYGNAIVAGYTEAEINQFLDEQGRTPRPAPEVASASAPGPAPSTIEQIGREVPKQIPRALAHGALGVAESVGTGIEYLGQRIKPDPAALTQPVDKFYPVMPGAQQAEVAQLINEGADYDTAVKNILAKNAESLRKKSEFMVQLGRRISESQADIAKDYEIPMRFAGKNLWDNPEMMKSPTWWAYNVFEMVPALATSMVPAAGSYKAIQIGGKAFGMSPALVSKLAQVGAMVTGGATGGALEGSQTYKAVLESGGSEQEAARAAEMMTLFSAGLNLISVGKMFSKAGPGLMSRARKMGVTGVVEGLTEGAEEPAEVIAKLGAKILTGQKVPTGIQQMFFDSLKEAATVAPIAAVTGIVGGMGGGQKVVGDDSQDLLSVDAEQMLLDEINKAISEQDKKAEPTAKATFQELKPEDYITITPSTAEESARTLVGDSAVDETLAQDALAQRGIAIPEEAGISAEDSAAVIEQALDQQQAEQVQKDFSATPTAYGVQIDPIQQQREAIRLGQPTQVEVPGAVAPGRERALKMQESESVAAGEQAGIRERMTPQEFLEDIERRRRPPEPKPSAVPEGDVLVETGRWVEYPPGTTADIDTAVNDAATSPENDLPEPTQAQKDAGNYKKSHISVQGMDISIENPKGSERSGVDPSGKPWAITMGNHYGYFKRSEGRDGDQIDVFVGPQPESQKVFIVDQVNPNTGKWDEHKVLLGFKNKIIARKAYLSNYEKGWKGMGAITEMSRDEFKKWIGDGKRKTKPVGIINAEAQDAPGVVPDQQRQPQDQGAVERTPDRPQKEADRGEQAVQPVEPEVSPETGAGVKQPWEMTREEYRQQRWGEHLRKYPGDKEGDNRQEAQDRVFKTANSKHAGAVTIAHTRKKPVPPEVLKDYPDLSPIATPEGRAEGEVAQRELFQEAKKYKSAEEFVASQKVGKLYHVSGKANLQIDKDYSPRQGQLGKGFYVTVEPEVWQSGQIGKREHVYEIDSSNLKIAEEYPSRSELIEWGSKNGYYKKDILKKPDGTVVLDLENDKPLIVWQETDKAEKLMTYKDPMTGSRMSGLEQEYLKAKGYDGVGALYSRDGQQAVIFNTDKIKMTPAKTKSQLTDIWNKAQGETLKQAAEQPLEAEARKYKSADEFVKAQRKNATGLPLNEMDKSDFQNWVGGENVVNGKIKVYRGIRGDDTRGLQKGDFLTTSKEYAKTYGENVLEYDIPVNQLNYFSGHKNGNPAQVGQVLGKGPQPTELIWNGGKKQTKSQLTDIWNKANAKGEVAPELVHETATGTIPAGATRQAAGRQPRVKPSTPESAPPGRGSGAGPASLEADSEPNPPDGGISTLKTPKVVSLLQKKKPASEMTPDELLAEWDRQAGETEKAETKDTLTSTPIHKTPGPTAKQKAKETADHLGNALDAFKKINKLLGEAGHFSTEKADENLYKDIKPLLKYAWDEIVAAGKSGAEFVQIALKNLSPKGRPYFEKFVREEIGGKGGTRSVDAGRQRETAADDDQGSVAGESPEAVPGTEPVEGPGPVRDGSGKGPVGDVHTGSERSDDEANGGKGQAKPDRKSGGNRGRAKKRVGTGRGRTSGVRGKPRGTDYVVPEGGLERSGSWKTAAKNNLDAIELSKKIIAEDRPATPEEQAVLSKYVGWGATELANRMFPGYSSYGKIQESWADSGWEDHVKRLNQLLAPEELKTAAKSTQYAHYTSEPVIRSIYKALNKMGFGGGKILEPGMGVGNFVGLIPGNMRKNTQYTGIEMDAVSAGIAQLLYPNHNILHADFIKQALPKNFFDAAFGNPPFGSTTILADPEYKRYRFKIHNYFFAKAIDRVRPGGMLTFVTSRYTMDAKGDKARAYIAKRADLVGAIRLPQTAFKKNAGTEVVTDVLFFQKRGDNAAPGGEKWSSLAEVETPEGSALINEYFANHPEMVLGRHSLTGSMYTSKEYTVLPADGNIEDHFAEAVETLPEKIYSPVREDLKELKQKVAERDFDPTHKKEGGLYISDKGDLMIVDHGSGVGIGEVFPKFSAEDRKWLKDYVGLRDALKQSHQDQLNDGDWKKSLKKLKKTYRAFVKKNGRINAFSLTVRKQKDEDGNIDEVVYRRPKHARLLYADAEGSLVAALEDITNDNKIVEAAALTQRTISPPTEPTIETVADALAVSLNDIGHLDIKHIAELKGTDEAEVIETLGDLIYEDPSGDSWTMADEYLSGNVVRKLEEARAAAALDQKYERNVDALGKVQPEPLAAKDITVSLGAPWIRSEDINAFGRDVLGMKDTKVTHHAAIGAWSVSGSFTSQGLRSSIRDFATAKRGPNELLESILNNRLITIKRSETVDGKTTTWTDKEATTAANEKAKDIQKRFGSWVWEDADRAKTLVNTYNRLFNNLAPRRFDGSHLTLPGTSSLINLYDHQKRAIWRTIQTGNAYLAHAVGAGKTFVMIASGMEMKRLGMINKPLYAVPKHMLGQFAREFNELYPMANVMVADENNFHTGNRRRFIAQATLNNPDAIVIPHSSFGLLKLREESIAPVRDEFIGQLRAALDEMQAEDDPRYLIKRMEKRIEQAEQRFDSMMFSGDKVVDFEEMGVDYLFVDEAHEFRKLDYITNRQMKGINPIGSKRAMDLFLKTTWLESQNKGRSHTFASGTPVTNTIAELYTAMRFFDPQGLEEDGLDHFDSWATMFARAAVGYEMTPSGRYTAVTRFAKFVNIPELMSRVRTFMDVLTSTQLGAKVKRPDVKGGRPDIVTTNKIPELKAYQDDVLQPRIVAAENFKPTFNQPHNPDPIINIATDGRLASIDMRLVDPRAGNNPDSKLNKYIDGIIETYRETKGNKYLDDDGNPSEIKGGAQICFYNVGFGAMVAKRRGFDARAWLMRRLKEAKIPIKKVAWIDDYNTAPKKEKLFKAVRDGKVRILLGSAKKMGTGMNVQSRLTDLHYLDPPWFPSDVEQPLGRIIRQGNQNEEVGIKWYATKGSYDATMWQLVALKSKFIEQAFLGDKSVRTMDDISESSQYEMASAMASGDERVIQLVALRGEVEKYSNLQREHQNNQTRIRNEIDNLEYRIKSSRSRVEDLTLANDKVPGYIREIQGAIGNKTYDNRKEFGEALVEEYLQVRNKRKKPGDVPLGKLNGFPLVATVSTYNEKVLREAGETPDGTKKWKSVDVTRYRTDVDLRLAPRVAEGVLWNGMNIDDIDHGGLVTSMVNAINKLPSKIRELESEIEESQSKIDEFRKRLGAPFVFERELYEKIEEAQRLERELADEGEDNNVEPVAYLSAEEAAESRRTIYRQFIDTLASLAATEKGVGIGGRSLGRKVNPTKLSRELDSTADYLGLDQIVDTFKHHLHTEYEWDSDEIAPVLEQIPQVQEWLQAQADLLDYPAVIGGYPNYEDTYKAAKDRIFAAFKSERGSLSFEKIDQSVYDDILIVARIIYQAGHTKAIKFTSELKKALADVWDNIKHLSRQIFNDVKRILKSERGSLSGGRDKISDIKDDIALEGYAKPQSDRKTDRVEKEKDVEPVAMQAESQVDAFRRRFQDQYLPLKRTEEFLEAQGAEIGDESPYLLEELHTGKAQYKLEKLEDEMIRPLMQIIKDRGISLGEFEDYLYARHAPERNEYIQSINEEFEDGGSGMTDEEAAEIIQGVRDSGKIDGFKKIEKIVRAISNYQRTIIRSAGLETPEIVDAWERYKYYVPLKGAPDEDMINTFGGKRGLGVRKSGTKMALGRRSKANDILANLFAQTAQTVQQAEIAKIGQAFLSMVEANPNDEMWKVYEPGDKLPTKKAKVGDKVRNVPDPMWARKGNVFQVTRDGEVYHIELKNKELATALNRLNQPEANAALHALGHLNRYLATINTLLNPEFVITNFERDIQTAMINLGGEQSLKMAKDVLKKVPSAMVGIRNALRGDKSHKMAKWYNRFKKAGGQVGFMDLQSVDKKIREIEDISARKGGPIRKARQYTAKLGSFIGDYNTIVENAVRLSAFQTAVESGMSEPQAASLSKNLTVNFNRKGEYGAAMNSMYLFYNAGIQGSARIIKALGHKNVRRIAYGITATAIAMAEMNRLVGGEDEDEKDKWDKVNPYLKQTNYIIMREDGPPVKVTLPYGFNIFVALGNAISDSWHYLESGKRKGRSPAAAAGFMLTAALDAFNPIGGSESLIKLISPTIADPFVDVAVNENFMGAPIKPDNMQFGPKKPESELYWSSVRPASKYIARKINELTGGDKVDPGWSEKVFGPYLGPEVLDYFWDYATGGAGRFYADTAGTAIDIAKRRPRKTSRIPILRKVVQDQNEWFDVREFRKNSDKSIARWNNLKTLTDTKERIAYAKKHPEVQLQKGARMYQRSISRLRKERRKAEAQKNDEQVKAIDKKIRQRAMQFNRLFYNKKYGEQGATQ